ncbi:MAG TPA: hypothetical protein VGM37_14530 [Armatimonadota bacterium]|jgi:hypothetical protein
MMSSPAQSGPDERNRAKEARITLPGSPFGVAWGFVYGPPWAKAETFLPQLRAMGAGFTKVYLFWSQIEPRKGHFDWQAVDAFSRQLRTPGEGLIAVFSSSSWATRLPNPLLPPSPAKNLDDYYRFVNALVKHCKGHVRYWQNDCEPNNPVYWSGTAEEFAAQLKVFRRAVKDADPKAVVVCGGYDGLFNPPGMAPAPGQEKGLAFFDTVLKLAAGDYDMFDLRLYANPYTISERVDAMRMHMAALGKVKPIVCTEYNGPGLFEYPVNRQYVGMVSQWAAAIAQSQAANGQGNTAQSNPVTGLYERRDTLAPETQMFLQGATQTLQDKFYRIQCRDLVMRNVFALSAGVQKTLFWDLWHDASQRDDLMTLMYGKQRLMDYEDGVLKRRYPAADAFQRMTEALAGVRLVTRVIVPNSPSLYVFEVAGRKRHPMFVAWEKRDSFTGEDAPARLYDWAWKARGARAADAFGRMVPAKVEHGRLYIPVSLTPIYIEPAG